MDRVVKFDPPKPPRVHHRLTCKNITSYGFINLEYYECLYYLDPPDKQEYVSDGSIIPHFLLNKGVDTFCVVDRNPITSADASIPAYLAVLWSSYSKRRFRDMHVVIKCVHREKDPDGERRLKAEVARSRMLGRRDRYFGLTCSLIECYQQFYHDDTYYCCVFPKMYGPSLTRLLSNSHGLSEQDYILFILYKTLQGLDVLHRLGHAHGGVCAAHIYLTYKAVYQVKLGFAATILDLKDNEDSEYTSPYMPAASVCRWAAAPEAYGDSGAAATEEGDVWMVGITALELGYGGLRVTSRVELESIVRKINVERRLPKKINESEETQHFPFCCLSRRPVFQVGSEHGCKKRVFSKGFVDLVVRCLDFQPEKRPTAAQLLCHHAFKRVQSWHFLPRDFYSYM